MFTIDQFYLEIADRIKTERNRKNITQEALGEYLELTRTSVVNLEKGRHRPSIYQLILIAKFLGVEYTALIPIEIALGAEKQKVNTDLSQAVIDPSIDKKEAEISVRQFLSSIQRRRK